MTTSVGPARCAGCGAPLGQGVAVHYPARGATYHARCEGLAGANSLPQSRRAHGRVQSAIEHGLRAAGWPERDLAIVGFGLAFFATGETDRFVAVYPHELEDFAKTLRRHAPTEDARDMLLTWARQAAGAAR